jgi:hypothetical protein
VKTAFVDGELLLEAHPPVDKEGQTYEPDLELFSQLLDKALGPTTAAVHWEFARDTLQVANGLPTVVGIEADLDPPVLPELYPTTVVDAGSTPAGPVAGADENTAPDSTVADATHIAEAAPAAQAARPEHEIQRETSLPAPLPPPDSSAKAPSSGARAFPADEPAEASAQPSP